ncbi:hypothetical protein F2Q68_00026275 [Brassica cretica]|uniref:Uncharacterized protein n=1 Tax=Brassica cretica TaxID=69181 RepID=A0A8S9IAL0_BRACR|nr:hypothetical protein F2Q68_00026275 [Brassica cretica]
MLTLPMPWAGHAGEQGPGSSSLASSTVLELRPWSRRASEIQNMVLRALPSSTRRWVHHPHDQNKRKYEEKKEKETSLFTRQTGVLDFSQARSEKHTELLY